MLSILIREINFFFTSSIGYLIIGIFLVINGLFLWVFNGNFNILDYGFSDLTSFFELAPWIFLFLIPAVTMRAFSDEKKTGTIELLFTKPISIKNIVLGKYFGAVVLIGLALLPTLLYVLTISQLGNPPGNWDFGSTLGSYLGLLFLVDNEISELRAERENQIGAFITAVFLCFFMYYGFEGIGSLLNNSDFVLTNLGMKDHFNSMARGVLDTRDIIYFLSISILFISFTIFNLQKEK